MKKVSAIQNNFQFHTKFTQFSEVHMIVVIPSLNCDAYKNCPVFNLIPCS